MAFCPLPALECQQEPLLRHYLFRLQFPPDGLRPVAAVVFSRSWCCPLLRAIEGRRLRLNFDLDRSRVRPLDAWCAAMRRARQQTLFAFLISLAFTLPAYAHIGSKDVYEEVNAGPYKLFVTIRTPSVIPGVATIEVRSSGAAISSMRVTPIPLTGDAAKHPPSSDAMQ